jgi:hypothetical protein
MRTMSSDSGRRLFASSLTLAALGASPVRAEVCESGNKPGSCYIVEPSLELVTQGTVVAPLGQFTPFVWHGAEKRVDPPPANGALWTQPGLDLRLGAGAWGQGAQEPMAIAQTTFSYLTAEGVNFLAPTDGNNGIWYRFACEEGTPLCYQDGAGGRLDVWQNASAAVRRAYRLTQTNPTPLPSSVTHVPMLVDYKMSVVVNGTREQGDQTAPGLSASTQVTFGFWEPFKDDLYNLKQKGVMASYRASGIHCSTYGFNEPLPTQGNTCSGTFLNDVPLSRRELLVLIVYAATSFDKAPICRNVDTAEGTQCLVRPWGASGHAAADPYVYVDPNWEYASWFELEMASDDSDTTWVTPERTAIDPETLTFLSDAGVSSETDAGAEGDADAEGDAESGDDSGDPADNDGDGDDEGDGDSGVDPDPPALDGGETERHGKKDSGGCQLGASRSPLPVALGLFLTAAALARRRRSERTRRGRSS